MEGIGKRRGSRKEKLETDELQTENKTKRGERDYTDVALTLNHLQPLLNLWSALMWALDSKFKP